ncbi:MAG: NAD(P)/FAD-dependent oxidoreductase, partial [Thermodesulfobacteriota bacterium]
MVSEVDFLLIGGGLASATAAETLRKEAAEGGITIISAENFLPYHRPPLSKSYLLKNQEEDRLLINKEEFYRENRIDLILNTKAVSVDPERKIVATDRVGDFHYGKLLIATGSSVKKLSVPGANLSGIYYLRTVACAEALRRAMTRAKRAVVIGGSFIGMELASSLSQKGIK